MSTCTNMRTMDLHKLINNVFAKQCDHECLHKLDVHTVETDHKLMMANVKFKLKAHNTTYYAHLSTECL